MKATAKALTVLVALILLLTGCKATDEPVSGAPQAVIFRDGHWAKREDVLFTTAMETGFYLYQAENGIPCTMDFVSGWNGPGLPDASKLAGNEHAFTAAGYLDLVEPHEGIKPEDIYETAFIFYMVYNKDTKAISTAGGYLDEGADEISGVIDASKVIPYIDLFHTLYDDYVSKNGEVY